MSDDFLKIATKEIKDDLKSLTKILVECKGDSDLVNHACEFQRLLHRIKGLAPMMGHPDIGELAQFTEKIANNLMENGSLKGSFLVFQEAISAMGQDLDGNFEYKIGLNKEKVLKNFATWLKK